METTNKILGDIRTYVEKETLSFIIGAGFSKNISQDPIMERFADSISIGTIPRM